MARVSTGLRRLACRLVTACAGVISLAVVATSCSGAAVPHAAVSPAQQAALSRFYVRKLWLSDGSHSVGCPVDVLGSLRIRRRLRVYTVVVCLSFTAKCVDFGAGTEGLVADMAGTRVVGVLRDDAPDEELATAEARIYPPSLRSVALGYINDGGPSSLWHRAAKMAGCPHWTAPESWQS
jgi:hypothetical protein